MYGLYFVSDETQNSHQLNGEGKIVKSILNATLSIKISSLCQKTPFKIKKLEIFIVFHLHFDFILFEKRFHGISFCECWCFCDIFLFMLLYGRINSLRPYYISQQSNTWHSQFKWLKSPAKYFKMSKQPC